MKRLLAFIALIAMVGVVSGLAGEAQAVSRGGKMIFARNADSLFLEDARRRLKQLFAGIVPGRSGSNS